jgi:hypothetical protein
VRFAERHEVRLTLLSRLLPPVYPALSLATLLPLLDSLRRLTRYVIKETTAALGVVT